MEIEVRSHGVEVSSELRASARSKVGHLERFLDGIDRAEVRFSEERNPRIAERDVCEVTVSGAGHHVRARAAAHEPLVALDRVLDKLEHLMEKRKGRLIGRSHPRHAGQTGGPAGPGGAAGGGGAGAGGESGEEPRIVKVKSFAVKPMSPDEAVMEMGMLSHDFFLFTNSETSRAAVVYRRGDGDIGLIDST